MVWESLYSALYFDFASIVGGRGMHKEGFWITFVGLFVQVCGICR